VRPLTLYSAVSAEERPTFLARAGRPDSRVESRWQHLGQRNHRSDRGACQGGYGLRPPTAARAWPRLPGTAAGAKRALGAAMSAKMVKKENYTAILGLPGGVPDTGRGINAAGQDILAAA